MRKNLRFIVASVYNDATCNHSMEEKNLILLEIKT